MLKVPRYASFDAKLSVKNHRRSVPGDDPVVPVPEQNYRYIAGAGKAIYTFDNM
ncbi:hypothetical protein [Rugamonas rubra]|jgi:hypothetical protein|uniref:hypothetical protein n=1 Tax=Rugamonas rubra TaxID=758825 RepID=UPI0015841825|nr:hypothetical protein [Rugamonas rubra]